MRFEGLWRNADFVKLWELGALAGGVLGETVGLRETLVIAGCGVLLASLWLAVSPVRGLRDMRPAMEAEPLAPLATEIPS